MYKVIEAFRDLKDGNHEYKIGDEYPREGLHVREARINELLGDNDLEKPFIKKDVKLNARKR